MPKIRWEIAKERYGYTLLHHLGRGIGQWRCGEGHTFRQIITPTKPHCTVCLREERKPLPECSSLVEMWERYTEGMTSMTRGAE